MKRLRRSVIGVAALFSLSSAACDKSAAPGTSSGSSSAASPSASASGAPTAEAMAPPESEPGEQGAIITISKSQVLVDDDPNPVVLVPDDQMNGFAPEHKTGDGSLFVKPLGAAFKKLRDEDKKRGRAGTSEAIVIADPNTSYRILTEVIYTLGQSEFGRYHLMVIAPPGQSPKKPTQTARLADIPDPKENRDKSLDLTLMISPEGIALKTSEGNIATGCERVGDGVAVPMKEGKHDLKELSRCAAIQKKAAPDETDATLSATPDTPYHLVLDVMDTLRSASDGEMFPDVHFGIPR